MSKNVGMIDRLLRLAVVVAIAVAYALGHLSGTIAIVLGAVALALLLTSLFSTCPAYSLLGVSTCARR
ncbi:DUF2892 domain-containing protein [Methylosinus sp. Sm6]|uniref:YgaP family membrane protein n=1 Tax=Methylosinus sp. Sm6 TaxID=2866948 RepID=UPI001C996BDE|nr:DUF2892 domain-containing protein [Methylosinus sp. Sm6]MBY6241729.1 DUF2892 domain-containing protein [Methylosinus sp. Sm6]